MKRSVRGWLIALAVVVAVSLPVRWLDLSWDLTADHRYTVSRQTRHIVEQVDAPMEVTLYLNGEMNSAFRRLSQSVTDMVETLHRDNKLLRLRDTDIAPREYALLERRGCKAVVISERTRDGKTVQTDVWPYLSLKYKQREMVLPLLEQNRGIDPEQNINRSVENIEFVLAEAVHSLMKDSVERVAFLEGHGELSKEQVYDLTAQLSRYFQVDRGVMGNETGVLDTYKAVIIADPQRPFSETDKYILDQYIMHGGKVMWLLNGVRFSDEMLTDDGVTPILPLELNLNDMLFRYGVRINPALVQDLQCLRIPVDVSDDPQRPQYQPLPWTYAPLLLTNEQSPVTRNTMQVSATMASCIDIVGGDDGLNKEVLLATSTASALTPTPARVDLSDLSIEQDMFRYAYIPVAVSVEGVFTSFFTHRIAPDNLVQHQPFQSEGASRQVVVAAGSVARNEWQNGEPLAAGFDRYSKTLFGNRDFLVRSVLWLTDDKDLLSLRKRTVTLRQINERRAYDNRTRIECISLFAPVVILLLIGGCVRLVRTYRYARQKPKL